MYIVKRKKCAKQFKNLFICVEALKFTLTFARFTLNMRKICALLFVVARLLQFLQQLPGKLPAGSGCCGVESLNRLCLAGYIKPGPSLSLGRQVFIARQRGTDVGTKALHFIHVQSSQGCGVRVVPVKTVAGIPSIMVISASLPFLCWISISISSCFLYMVNNL